MRRLHYFRAVLPLCCALNDLRRSVPRAPVDRGQLRPRRCMGTIHSYTDGECTASYVRDSVNTPQYYNQAVHGGPPLLYFWTQIRPFLPLNGPARTFAPNTPVLNNTGAISMRFRDVPRQSDVQIHVTLLRTRKKNLLRTAHRYCKQLFRPNISIS